MTRHEKATALAANLIASAKAMLDLPELRGRPWRRAIRSKKRRIRRKGEKGRTRDEGLRLAIFGPGVAVAGAVRASVILGQKPG